MVNDSIKASIFRNFNNVVDKKPLGEIAAQIINGTFKTEIDLIRHLIREGKFVQAEWHKKNLLAFTPSATFQGGRKLEYLTAYSGCIVLDIDDIPLDKYAAVFANAINSPFTFFCFRSPSGNGIKVLSLVTSEKEQHEIAYSQLANHYEELMQIQIDRSGKDVTRLCYISYDPDAYLNTKSERFHVQISDTTNESLTQVKSGNNELKNDANLANYANQFQKCIEFTEKKFSFVNGSRNNFVHYLSCNCNRASIPEDEALQLILERFNYDEKEVNATVKSGYKNNASDFAKLANFASPQKINENKQEEFSVEISNTPFFPDKVFSSLPQLLQDGCKVFNDNRERDVFLISALTILSGCFTGIKGVYDGKKVYPNLFCFVIAPPASGKSALTFAKKLANSIHDQLLQESNQLKTQYEFALEDYKAIKRKKKGETLSGEEPPQKPKFKMLFIPANSSTAAVMYNLHQSDGIGIICETEADTMVNAFKNDWSGYSDLLRKAFHHESCSSSRKKDNEYIHIDPLRLSGALTGTPSQVPGIISSAEDGLFSRILFYVFKSQSEWRDVSPKNKINLTEHFDRLSKNVFSYASFINKTETTFELTENHWDQLNKKFTTIHDEVKTFFSEDATSSVKRLGLITFRIAMILSVLRNAEEGNIETSTICEDEDFNTALALVDVFLQHMMVMYNSLPKSTFSKLDKRKLVFYEALPVGRDFSRAEAVDVGKKLGIKERSVGSYLSNLLGPYLIEGGKYGTYRKKE